MPWEVDKDIPSAAAAPEETLISLLQVQAHNLQGETLISKNLFNQAIKDFSLALEINPHYVDALVNRGSAYAILGMLDDALMDFTHALKFERNDPEIYHKRGEIYLQNNMYDEAIKDFTSALVLNPVFGSAHLNRGRAYSQKGLPDEAMADYNQAVRTDFEHTSFSFSAQPSPVMYIDEEKTDNEEESAKFKQLGLADLKNKKFEEALENFTQAIDLSPSDAEGYIYRAVVYLRLLQPDKAMSDFNQAALFDPLNASLYYWRANAWKAKNDSLNMKEDLKLSCELGHEPACTEYRKLKPPTK
jgi:Flp pilus assembly protein TadD